MSALLLLTLVAACQSSSIREPMIELPEIFLPEPECQSGQVFNPCGSSCERSCEPVPCNKMCVPKCECPMNEIMQDGKCTPMDLACALPGPVPGCEGGQEWNTCAAPYGCDRTCDKLNPVCPASCEARCACPPSAPFLENGICVTENVCEKRPQITGLRFRRKPVNKYNFQLKMRALVKGKAIRSSKYAWSRLYSDAQGVYRSETLKCKTASCSYTTRYSGVHTFQVEVVTKFGTATLAKEYKVPVTRKTPKCIEGQQAVVRRADGRYMIADDIAMACDKDTGLYIPEQCGMMLPICRCVDPETGVTIEATSFPSGMKWDCSRNPGPCDIEKYNKYFKNLKPWEPMVGLPIMAMLDPETGEVISFEPGPQCSDDGFYNEIQYTMDGAIVKVDTKTGVPVTTAT